LWTRELRKRNKEKGKFKFSKGVLVMGWGIMEKVMGNQENISRICQQYRITYFVEKCMSILDAVEKYDKDERQKKIL
jgi:hypothetical protein